MTKHIKINDKNYQELMKIIGLLQIKEKRRVTIDDAIDFLIRRVKVNECQ